MARVERVTVTMPEELLREIDRMEQDWSRFVAGAVRRELERRRREELRRSLENPHGESAELAEVGLGAWARGLLVEDGEALVDSSAGRKVQWIPGEGWVEERA